MSLVLALKVTEKMIPRSSEILLITIAFVLLLMGIFLCCEGMVTYKIAVMTETVKTKPDNQPNIENWIIPMIVWVQRLLNKANRVLVNMTMTLFVDYLTLVPPHQDQADAMTELMPVTLLTMVLFWTGLTALGIDPIRSM